MSDPKDETAWQGQDSSCSSDARQADCWTHRVGFFFSLLPSLLVSIPPSPYYILLFFPPVSLLAFLPPSFMFSSFLHFLARTFQFNCLDSWNQLANCQFSSLLPNAQCLTWTKCLLTQDNKKYRKPQEHWRDKQVIKLPIRSSNLKSLRKFPHSFSLQPDATLSLKCPALHAKCGRLQRSRPWGSLGGSIPFSSTEKRAKKTKKVTKTFCGNFN